MPVLYFAFIALAMAASVKVYTPKKISSSAVAICFCNSIPALSFGLKYTSIGVPFTIKWVCILAVLKVLKVAFAVLGITVALPHILLNSL